MGFYNMFHLGMPFFTTLEALKRSYISSKKRISALKPVVVEYILLESLF